MFLYHSYFILYDRMTMKETNCFEWQDSEAEFEPTANNYKKGKWIFFEKRGKREKDRRGDIRREETLA